MINGEGLLNLGELRGGNIGRDLYLGLQRVGCETYQFSDGRSFLCGLKSHTDVVDAKPSV